MTAATAEKLSLRDFLNEVRDFLGADMRTMTPAELCELMSAHERGIGPERAVVKFNDHRVDASVIDYARCFTGIKDSLRTHIRELEGEAQSLPERLAVLTQESGQVDGVLRFGAMKLVQDIPRLAGRLRTYRKYLERLEALSVAVGPSQMVLEAVQTSAVYGLVDICDDMENAARAGDIENAERAGEAVALKNVIRMLKNAKYFK